MTTSSEFEKLPPKHDDTSHFHKDPVLQPRYTKSKLPWLEASRRKSSTPKVPGAFYEDHADTPPASPLKREQSVVPAVIDTGQRVWNDKNGKSLTTTPQTNDSHAAGAIQVGTFEHVSTNGSSPDSISPKATSSGQAKDAEFVALAYRSSIASLEKLMQEAVTVAEDAAATNNTNELPLIIHEAAEAMRKVSEVHDQAFGTDHAMSSGSETSLSTSDSSRSSSSLHSSRSALSRMDDMGGRGRRAHFIPAELPDARISKRHVDDDDRSIGRDFAHPTRRAPSRPSYKDRKYTSTRDDTKDEQARIPDAALHSSPRRECEIQPVVNPPPPHPIPARMTSLARRHARFKDEPSDGNVLKKQPSDHKKSAYGASPTHGSGTKENWGRDKYNEKDFETYPEIGGLNHRHHLTIRPSRLSSINQKHHRQPIARNWHSSRKHITAWMACINTALVGLLIGIYAGEVPAIQYVLADEEHIVILGNTLLFLGLAISSLLFWPLPLLHGRKPYILTALAVCLPLQFPQAVIVLTPRNPSNPGYRVGLLLSRGLSGLALGFANINFETTLLDLFGSSLQSEYPHQELIVLDDVRRHGGGMGMWLGFWTWCFTGSLACGFLVGASIITKLDTVWGFYISVILIVITLVSCVLTPETRRASHRRTTQDIELPDESVSRRIARGEVRMHIQGDGPRYWLDEVSAGAYLSIRMFCQLGYAIMAVYLGWIYAQVVLIIVLLGNLLSAEYQFTPEYVGLGVLSVAVGAFFAIPLTKANMFSRARTIGPRTDSMTLQPFVTRSSHFVRRLIFTIALPFAGLAYTLASGGPATTQYMTPIIFAGSIGFLSILAIAECHGIIMESFDTSDLQPGVNSRHRLQSLASVTRNRRTNYTSYPRVTAGLILSQSIGFGFAAIATAVGGRVTRTIGAQKATATAAAILLGLTVALALVLWRWKQVQVIPNELFGSKLGNNNLKRESEASISSTGSWRAVVIGNPSGKTRRMNIFELGALTRWTEIRRLNRLLTRSTTQGLNQGWQ